MYTFLLADNSKTILDVLEFTLEKFNYKVFSVTDEQGIFSILEGNNIDVVLMSDTIDGEDGTELAVRILDRFDVLVLMMSYSQSLDLKLKAKRAGVSGWIIKPFIPERLVKIIVKTFFK